jgi:hypothetical protein
VCVCVCVCVCVVCVCGGADIIMRLVDTPNCIISTPTFGMYKFLGVISRIDIIDVYYMLRVLFVYLSVSVYVYIYTYLCLNMV